MIKMMLKPFLALVVFSLIKANALVMEKPLQSQTSSLAVVFQKNVFKAIDNNEINPDDVVASGTFLNHVNVTGWGQLEIETNAKFNNSLQAYAAGYAEGALTKDLIADRWENAYKDFCQPETKYCNDVYNFIETNLKYMKSKFNSNPYWEQVYYILLQMQGLEDGYFNRNLDLNIRLQPFGVLLLNIDTDMEDLETVLKDKSSHKVVGSGSCSALIKMLPGYKDLYAAHDTWTVYTSMLRVIKKYTLNYKDKNDEFLPGRTCTFTTEPGRIFSGDDFYILSSGLVTMETTIGNSNKDLWKFVKPENSLFEGIRNLAANRMASNGKEWCEIFSQYNMGTYNNEWMIVDYNKFIPGQKPSDGLLFVLEQLPGVIEFKDVTNVLLEQMYWPSYNSPYFKKIFNMSGTPALVDQHGDWFTYDKTPRALIFARNQSSVTDVKTMMKLMRYNNFKNDPLSSCNCIPPYSGENAIAARSDLNPLNGKYPFAALEFRNHGATDAKITSSEMRKKLEMVAECGPTHDQQPVFVWSESPFANISHRGMPDRYDFQPVHVKWGNLH